MAFFKEVYGNTKDGKTAYLYTITNDNGMVVKFTDFGAAIVSLEVPDRDGNSCDVVLGYDKLEGYFVNDPNFGGTIGRHANRIAGASFVLNGETYTLDKNSGRNNLHGGFDGYNKRMWEADFYEDELGQTMAFSYMSPDLDQGFPGNLEIVVRYIITDDNCVIIEYEAESDKDTLVNLTNHSYFNLAGYASGNILGHKVWIDSDNFTPGDAELVPTGEIRSVEGTPMDFRTEKTIGQDIDADDEQIKWGGGYDHNWLLKTTDEEISLVARLACDISGIAMEVYTDMPAMQMYTCNFEDRYLVSKNGQGYVKNAGVCFETQYVPDSINQDNFEKSILKAGELYNKTTVYKFINC